MTQTTSHALEAKYEKQDQEATEAPSKTNFRKITKSYRLAYFNYAFSS